MPTGTELATPRQSTASLEQSQSDHTPAGNVADDKMEASEVGCGPGHEDDGLSKVDVCDECNKARQEEELRNQLHFANKGLYIKHVAKPTESCKDAECASDSGGGLRKSRRSRAGKAFQTYSILASSDETLADLKLKVSTPNVDVSSPSQFSMKTSMQPTHG